MYIDDELSSLKGNHCIIYPIKGDLSIELNY